MADLDIWSLGPQIEDHLKASSWSWRKLSTSSGRVNGIRCSGEDAFGLVMMAYIGWVGRTHADAGEIWPVVYDRLAEPMRSNLFLKGTAAKPDLRACIKAAAVKFGLRHTFDSDEPQQAYMRTFQLQFGLSWTREAINEYQPPVVVSELTNSSHPNYSAEFVKLWEALLKYRHRIIDERRLLQSVSGNSWLPEGGTDRLLEWARPQRAKQTDGGLTQVFQKPRLTSDGRIRLVIAPGLTERLSLDRYLVRVDHAGASSHYELRRTGQSFNLFLAGVEQRSIQLPAVDPIVSVCVTLNGCALFEEEIDIRPANGLFAVYSEGGVCRNEDEGMDPRSGCILLHVRDVEVRPEHTWQAVFGESWRMTFVSPPVTPEFGLFIGDDRLWPYQSGGTAPSMPRWTGFAKALGSEWGKATEVHIERHPPAVEPVTLTIGRTDFPVTRKQGLSTKFVASVPVEPQLLHDDAVAILRCWGEGTARSLPCFLAPGKHSGHLVEKHGLWEALNGIRCDKSVLKGRLRLDAEFDEGLILSGNRICGRVKDRMGFIDVSRVSGLGEELQCVPGITNSSSCLLTRAVYSSGELKQIDVANGELILALRRPIEATASHRVRLWVSGESLPRDCGIVRGDADIWHIPHPGKQVLAVALFYSGQWLGGRFVGERSIDLLASLCTDVSDWPAIAGELNAFRLPLLRPQLRQRVMQAVEGNPAAVLMNWLPSGAQASDEAAELLIQEFLATLMPSNEQAAEVITRAQMLSGDPLLDSTRGWRIPSSLLRSAPLFLAATAYWGLAELYSVNDARDLAPLCGHLRQTIAGLSNNIEWDAAAELGHIDTKVLEGLRREAIQVVRQRGVPSAALQIAARSTSFAAYAAVGILEEWAKTLHS